MTPKFKIGDSVRLFGGGPTMTVIDTHYDFVNCCWFDKNDHLQQFTFNERALVDVTEDYLLRNNDNQ